VRRRVLLRALLGHGRGGASRLQGPRRPGEEGHAQEEATPAAEKEQENRGPLGSRAR